MFFFWGLYKNNEYTEIIRWTITIDVVFNKQTSLDCEQWFLLFSLKKTHLVLVYNAENMAAEITVNDLNLYIGLRKELQGQKPTSTYLPGQLIREYIR